MHSLMLLCCKLFTHPLSLSLFYTCTNLPSILCSGNRVALVQAALARQLDNEDEGNPMSSRRPTASQPEPIISPSISFTDENGLTNNSSQGSTSSGHLQVSYSCDRSPDLRKSRPMEWSGVDHLLLGYFN